MENAQAAFGVEDEDLRGATIVDGFFRVFITAGYDAETVEFNGIAGDRAEIVEQLHIDGTELHAHAGLLAEVFASTAGHGQSSGFGATSDRRENCRVGSVEFFQQF